jgi:hypothetical protein
LGARVVDAYLKHREAAFQFDRAALCAFLGAELGVCTENLIRVDAAMESPKLAE